MLAHNRALRLTSRYLFLMSGTTFDLIDSASEFGTILESDQEVVFGEFIDNEPTTPAILTDSTNL